MRISDWSSDVCSSDLKPTIPMVPNPVMIPITLGSAMFSLTEPFPGKALEYNRSYERDHFFANGQQLPYLFTGCRFVATRAIKVRRRLAPDNPVSSYASKGSFLDLYWVLSSDSEVWFDIADPNFGDPYAFGTRV